MPRGLLVALGLMLTACTSPAPPPVEIVHEVTRICPPIAPALACDEVEGVRPETPRALQTRLLDVEEIAECWRDLAALWNEGYEKCS